MNCKDCGKECRPLPNAIAVRCKDCVASHSSDCSGASVPDSVVDGLRKMLADRENVPKMNALPPEDAYCGECGAKQAYSLQSLWVERYAELLGCEPRPGAVAVAIGELHDEMGRCKKSISRHRRVAYERGVLDGKSTDQDT
jgi:hypothetical protein